MTAVVLDICLAGRLILTQPKLALSFELFKNTNREPVQDWISSDAEIRGQSVALDGDRLNGDAFYIQLYRKTEFWRSYLYYRNISPQYRADVGFAVKTTAVGEHFFINTSTFSTNPGYRSLGLEQKSIWFTPSRICIKTLA